MQIRGKSAGGMYSRKVMQRKGHRCLNIGEKDELRISDINSWLLQ